MLLTFEIRDDRGRCEVITADAERVLVGTGGHCDIRLAIDQGGVEHAVLEATGDLVRVRCIDPRKPLLVDGAPVSHGVLRAGAILAIGGVRMRVTFGEGTHAGVGRKEKPGSKKRLWIMSAVLAATTVGMALAPKPAAGHAAGPPENAPDLFAQRETTCNQASAASAFAVARESLRNADARRQRYTFIPQEGVVAVQLLQRATVCFEAAGATRDAATARAEESELRERVVADYALHRLRLEHAIGVDDGRTALREVRLLRSYVQGTGGDYVTWLTDFERIAQMQGAR